MRRSQESGNHIAVLSTLDNEHELILSSKDNSDGCRTNGGELLCLSLASCYCNDIYRESHTFNIDVLSVDVKVIAVFGGVGESAKSISYTPTVKARASEDKIQALILHTDNVAEIHNTIRQGMPVVLDGMSAISV